jgi:hypothetical protein
MTVRDRIRAAISDSYYDARNDGLTMEHAADQATAKVMAIIEEPEWGRRLADDEAAYRRRNRPGRIDLGDDPDGDNS